MAVVVAVVRELAWMICCSLLAFRVKLLILRVFCRGHTVRLWEESVGRYEIGGGMRTYVRGIVLDVFLGWFSAVFCLESLFPCLDAGLDMCNVHVWNGVR